jgi:hypothetical protein
VLLKNAKTFLPIAFNHLTTPVYRSGMVDAVKKVRRPASYRAESGPQLFVGYHLGNCGYLTLSGLGPTLAIRSTEELLALQTY